MFNDCKDGSHSIEKTNEKMIHGDFFKKQGVKHTKNIKNLK